MILSVSSRTKTPFTIINVKDVWFSTNSRLYWTTNDKPLEVNSIKFEIETDTFYVYQDFDDPEMEDLIYEC